MINKGKEYIYYYKTSNFETIRFRFTFVLDDSLRETFLKAIPSIGFFTLIRVKEKSEIWKNSFKFWSILIMASANMVK